MVKKKLLALPELRATPGMLRAAAEDTPTVTEHKFLWSNQKQYETSYREPLHIRCLERDGILKVAYFSVEVLRLGGRKPMYELYLDKAHDQFLTFCHTDGKWHTAKLDRLEWPAFVRYRSKVRITQKDLKHIRRYFGTDGSAYEVIQRFQEDVRQKELMARHKRETDPWDEENKQVPALPRDWTHWSICLSPGKI